MRNTAYENDMEHSLQVTMIAHALCEIKNKFYGGEVDLQNVLLYAIYHEVSEVITGDLPTPIKYDNPELFESYNQIEQSAVKKIHSMLPEELQDRFEFMFADKSTYEYKIVKAADKISAYIKCVEEEKAGNQEFSKAKESILKGIYELKMEEVDYWMETFSKSYELTIDELN